MEVISSPQTPAALGLARHVVGMGLVMWTNPLLYYESGIFTLWASTFLALVVIAAGINALYALFFTVRAKKSWPASFIRIAWVLAVLWVLGGWNEYNTIRGRSAASNTTENVVSHESPVAAKTDVRSAAGVTPPGKSPTNNAAVNWSENLFDQFDSVADIERRARQYPKLNQPDAWSAVIAWQAHNMRDASTPANRALYYAVGTVLDGLNEGKGVCRPGKAVMVSAAWATPDLPAGTWVAANECERP